MKYFYLVDTNTKTIKKVNYKLSMIDFININFIYSGLYGFKKLDNNYYIFNMLTRGWDYIVTTKKYAIDNLINNDFKLLDD